jgi:hypothetical protein
LSNVIACNEKAKNRLVDIEYLTEDSSHSLDESEDNHKEKIKRAKKESREK